MVTYCLKTQNKHKRAIEGCYTEWLNYVVSRSIGLPKPISSSTEVDQGVPGQRQNNRNSCQSSWLLTDMEDKTQQKKTSASLLQALKKACWNGAGNFHVGDYFQSAGRCCVKCKRREGIRCEPYKPTLQLEVEVPLLWV